MTSCTEASLVLQREKLQKQLQEQRKLIEKQLSKQVDKNNDVYPRSVTMRFLSKRPELIGHLPEEDLVRLVATMPGLCNRAKSLGRSE